MTIQMLVDKITQLPEPRSDVAIVPPIELVAFIVRLERCLRQWKVSTLADFADVSISTVERVERGEKVSDQVLDRIARGLGYDAGHFTRARTPLSTESVVDSMSEIYGNLEAVRVVPMKTQKSIREAASCYGALIHRPLASTDYDTDIDLLKEWLDLASFTLSDLVQLPLARGRRQLYRDILCHVGEMERQGLNILSGTVNVPQQEFPDWRIAVVSISAKAVDPGAAKRCHVFVDRRLLNLPTDWKTKLFGDFNN